MSTGIAGRSFRLRWAGILIVNHPNFRWALGTDDIRPVEDLKLFELYNCHPVVRNEGDASHMSTEAMWDKLLTDGMMFYGVASDDAHSDPSTYSAWTAGPGKGWAMVKAKELAPQANCDALVQGDFCATIGVVLRRVELSPSRMLIEIDRRAANSEVKRGTAFGRPAAQGAVPGERIDFLGTGGRLLPSIQGSKGEYVPTGKGYVRARAVVTREIDGNLVEFCAWTQPVFLE